MSPIKNVIILEDSSKAKLGGGQVVTLQTAGVLRDAGYSLILADSSRPSLFKDQMAPLADKILHLYHFGRITNKAVASSYSMSLSEMIITPFLFLYNTGKLVIEVRKNSLNNGNTIIYSATKKGLITARILHLLLRIPFIHHAHSVEPNNLLSRILTRSAMRKAQKIICVSRTVQESLQMQNTEVIYNPVQTEKNSQLLPPVTKTLQEPVVVAAFGSLIRIKGLEYLIKAIPLMRHREKVNLRIYGEGELKDELARSTDDKNILKGFTNNVRELLHHEVHILAFPSIIPEACPTIIVQSLSMGVPAISTNIGGQSELVKDLANGILVDICDSAQFARALDKLIDSPELYRQLSAQALLDAEKFNFTHFRIKILEAFNSSALERP